MNGFLSFPVLVFFGTLPSFFWLSFYLKKDSRPEPKWMVIKVFLFGMLITIPAILFEKIAFWGFNKLNISSSLLTILNIFLGISFIEEFLKFFVIKISVLNSPQFDEPVDAMIYMIIAALGFAAVENILVVFGLKPNYILGVLILRLLGATFLHSLSSAIIGFFLGLYYFKPERKKGLVLIGFLLAILLHGFYNFFIINSKDLLMILFPFFLLTASLIFVLFGFQRLKKLNPV